MQNMMEQLFALGGWPMGAIGGCSVLALGILGERLFFLWREERFLAAMLKEWRGALPSPQDVRFLEKRTARRPRWFGALAGAALEEGRLLSPEALREHLDQFRHGALRSWERGLGLLATLGRITPLLGLLGTVLGMIRIFQKLPSSGGADMGMLSQGIWQALFTTAAGLSVAIPVVLAHAFLFSRVDRLEEMLQDLLRLLWRGMMLSSEKPAKEPFREER